MVVWRGSGVSDIDILEAAGKQRLVPLDHALVRAARSVGTSFGDRGLEPPSLTGGQD
jgi:hypothetical protein